MMLANDAMAFQIASPTSEQKVKPSSGDEEDENNLAELSKKKLTVIKDIDSDTETGRCERAQIYRRTA